MVSREAYQEGTLWRRTKPSNAEKEGFNIQSQTSKDHVHGNPQNASPSTERNKFVVFCCFCRLYAWMGTIMAILSMSLLPVETISDLSSAYFIGVLKTASPLLLIHIFGVGINELYDVEIDKINKPYLPLASGEISTEVGIVIVAISAILSIGIGLTSGSLPLLCSILTYFFLGIAYSADLPFLRWKKSSFLATASITFVRIFAAQLAIFIHFQINVFRKPMMFTKSIIFATVFMFIYMPGVALFKDIPDVDGDRANGCKTLCVTLGKEKVFKLVIYMLLVAYVTSAVAGAFLPSLLNKIVIVLGHSVIASLIFSRARSVDLSNTASVESFYMLLWMLLCAEYILIPFFR